MSNQHIERTIINEPLRHKVWESGESDHVIKERLVGTSLWATEAREAVVAHAAHDNPVLIDGETGTGKEFLARLIHKLSDRCRQRFISILIGPASEESTEQALFGSLHRLFYNNDPACKGLIESAGEGTIYININSNPAPSLKKKIERLIRRREYNAVGDDSPKSLKARIILSLTTRSIGNRSEQIKLPVSDRLSVPALRHRKEDIELLVSYFIREYCLQSGKERRQISADALAMLHNYDWPGNVGELKRVIREAILKSSPPCLDSSLLPVSVSNPGNLSLINIGRFLIPDAGLDLKDELERLERELLCQALKQCKGVQARAARLLGLSPTTLNMKIARFQIDLEGLR